MTVEQKTADTFVTEEQLRAVADTLLRKVALEDGKLYVLEIPPDVRVTKEAVQSVYNTLKPRLGGGELVVVHSGTKFYEAAAYAYREKVGDYEYSVHFAAKWELDEYLRKIKDWNTLAGAADVPLANTGDA
jgi:hypothetical protein